MQTNVCIVTGGSRGIGLATALRFANSHRLVIAARGKQRLDDAKAKVEAAGGHCTAVVADVSTADGAKHVVERAVEAGPLDLLVNNAGTATLAPIDETTDEDFQRSLATNVGGVFHMTRAVWPFMRARKSGVIVNVSSLASIDPFPGFSVYGGCKAWVNSFTKAVAEEGRPLGIRVFAVAPGAVETELLRSRFPDFPADQALDPDDVAAAIQAVCDRRLKHATGQIIFVRK